MNRKKKKFDCVEMMHRGAREIYKKTRHMTVEEEVAYWRDRSRQLKEKAEIARRKGNRRIAGQRGL